MAVATAGFSGAEIEQAVISGLFAAFAAHHELTTELMVRELAATHPLSQTMAERLSRLRAWARDRTVNADAPEWRTESVAPLKAVSWVTDRRVHAAPAFTTADPLLTSLAVVGTVPPGGQPVVPRTPIVPS